MSNRMFPGIAPWSPGIHNRVFFAVWIVVGMLVLCLLGALVPSPVGSYAESGPWREVAVGLYVGEFASPFSQDSSGAGITVVRIDPKYYSFRLLAASEHGRQRMTIKEWCRNHDLVAAVNAGMFQEDGITSVGYMKNFSHINNPRVSRENTFLAFNPTTPDEPEIRIIDRECEDFNALKRRYGTLVQSIRMISCQRQNVWSPQSARWSTVAVGTDTNGNVLFLFNQSPRSVHEFIEILLALPLSLTNAMYLEGGPQASLYLSTGGTAIERYGSLETGFRNGESIRIAFPLPNVIGIVKKDPARDREG